MIRNEILKEVLSDEELMEKYKISENDIKSLTISGPHHKKIIEVMASIIVDNDNHLSNSQVYKRIKKLGTEHDLFYMVGDQMDRDINFSKSEGYVTIYFPGGFSPRWSNKVQSPDADYVISNFQEAANIVLDRHNSGSESSSVASNT